MSRIFDALKKADHLRDSGIVEPALSEATARVESNNFRAATATEEPPVVPSPDLGESVEAGEAQPRRVVQLRVSALSPVFPFDDLHSQAAEQYRIIRTKIMHHPMRPKTMVVSSPTSGDGKTVTAINLAAVLALKQDFQVLLIDADLRRRSVSEVLGIPTSPGLGEVLNGECQLDDAVVSLEPFPNLWILPAGVSDRNPAELLASPRWKGAVAESRQRFDFVVIDATPMAVVADFELVQVECESVILVIRPDHTDRKTCLEALSGVAKNKLIGTVLNCVEEWFLYKHDSYGYYKS
jgi:capsular exopolysaccharide synthesis family protein